MKELIDDEIENRLNKGQKTLEAIDLEVTQSSNLMGANSKKIKFYKDLIEKAAKGQEDTFLLDKLAEL